MAGFLLHLGATFQCAHAAPATLAGSGARARMSGQAVAVQGDRASVAGCPFQVPAGPGTKPQPCVAVVFPQPALRVRVGGKPALLHPAATICQSAEGIPAGPATPGRIQPRVRGT